MRPFLKWAGGKYKLVEEIRSALPSGRRLVEPFVGSGAVFLNLDYEEYLLADINRDLITLYQTLKDGGLDFIMYCKEFFVPENNNQDAYYKFRELFNHTEDPYHKSAIFVYLNRHCFNGLCRYNAKGLFNVPFGKYANPYFPEREMTEFYKRAQKATFVCTDFRQLMTSCIQPGDVVYCDPPYIPLTETANFTGYSGNVFGDNEQVELARLANYLADHKVPVLISNHYTPRSEELYSNAWITILDVQRNISCKGDNRAVVQEVLALFNKGR